jgi:rhodanese-related sulfurtransferase
VSEAPRIGHREVQRLIEDGAQVLDALPADDYARQHIASAINVPLEAFTRDLLRDLDPARPTVTYCADNECDLSSRLAARLQHEGFMQVYEYAASLADWMAYGLPIEGAEAPVPRAGSLARRDFVTVGPDERLADVALRPGGETVCAVVDRDGVLLGRLRVADIQAHPDARAGDVAHPGPSTFRPDVPLSKIGEWFERRKVDAFIITTPDGRPFGVLHRSEVEAVVAAEATRR